jgi:phospholipid/cholesterol/gamma-HCH transport system permease protein
MGVLTQVLLTDEEVTAYFMATTKARDPMHAVMNPFQLLGAAVLRVVNDAGAITVFLLQALGQMLFGTASRQFVKQCAFVGVESIPIILLTAFFTGAVLALQSFKGLDGGPLANTQVGRLVSTSMLRELGPVLAGLMLSSRVGAAMAAELGTMRVTEQIDALTTLATNPMRYLVVPRISACLMMLPLLVVLGNLVGIMGGWVVSTHVLGISSHQYMVSALDAIGSEDQLMTLVKAAVFGLLVGLMGTYHGFNTSGGAAGVGRATTQAVVFAAVAILVSDYFITAMFV